MNDNEKKINDALIAAARASAQARRDGAVRLLGRLGEAHCRCASIEYDRRRKIHDDIKRLNDL